jgi:hypothetical protein
MDFNHNKWIEAKENASWDERKKMAQFLISNQTLIGKSKQDIVEKLGNNENLSNVDSDELYYIIECTYGNDIDPIKIEYLVISLNSNNTVIKVCRKVTLDKT